MKTIGLFNSTGFGELASLNYHLTWMLAELGHRCLAVDFDPMASLSSMFLSEEKYEEMFSTNRPNDTIAAAFTGAEKGGANFENVKIHRVAENIGLIAGDPDMAIFSQKVGRAWVDCSNGDQRAYQTLSVLPEMIDAKGKEFGADFCLIHLGMVDPLLPLSILIADHFVVPILEHRMSIYGLKGLGTLIESIQENKLNFRGLLPTSGGTEKEGNISPLGYVVVSRHSARHHHPKLRSDRDMVSEYFYKYLLGKNKPEGLQDSDDPFCIADLRYNTSLATLASDARKPMFELKPADGAIGSLQEAARNTYAEYKDLASKLLDRIDQAESAHLN